MTECCELCRVALTRHETPVTKIISIALKFIRKHCPGIRLIVSFADTQQGHHGGIYQGGNWVFAGSVELGSWIIYGKKMHPRSVVMKYGSQSLETIKKVDPNAYKKWGLKHRYLMPLDDQMKKQIEPLRQPYPKRATSKDNVASGVQSEEGGATPTVALQK
jgi:hypothetical protein